MKKIFAAVLAVCMILTGLSLRGAEERLEPVVTEKEGGCVRIDTHLSADAVFTRLSARMLWSEKLDGVTVYYGYSDFVNGYENVCGRRVNVMVAERDGMTAVGMPLLVGSY